MNATRSRDNSTPELLHFAQKRPQWSKQGIARCTMSSRSDSAAVRPRSRRSIAHVPRSKITSSLDKENGTVDLGSAVSHGGNEKSAMKDRKSRSKSLGPGGLDALQNTNGNRRKVSHDQILRSCATQIADCRRLTPMILSRQHLSPSNRFSSPPCPSHQCETSHHSKKLAGARRRAMHTTKARAQTMTVQERRGS